VSGNQGLNAALLGVRGSSDPHLSPTCPIEGRWVGANPDPDPADGPAPPPPTTPREEVNQMRRPSLEELQRQLEEEGGCEATDGCFVEPDGYCDHQQPSWLLALGLI
jgi:hypothetical protein